MALPSNISLIGGGIEDVTIQGTITGPASDAGPGQCYICNVSIDGKGQSALIFGDSTNSKSNFVINVKISTSVATSSYGMTVGNNQILRCIQLVCPPLSPLFISGINVSGNGNLRMWHSIISTDRYSVTHESSQYTEVYNSLFGSNLHTFQISSGFVNVYNCTLAGGMDISGGIVKHVNSFHDGPFNASSGAKVWVSGMKWTEEPGATDVWFELSGINSQIIVSNSKAAVNSTPQVVSVGEGTIFKAFNSEFTNRVIGGPTIVGPSSVTVYLYYCVLSSNVTGVQTADSTYKYGVDSD